MLMALTHVRAKVCGHLADTCLVNSSYVVLRHQTLVTLPPWSPSVKLILNKPLTVSNSSHFSYLNTHAASVHTRLGNKHTPNVPATRFYFTLVLSRLGYLQYFRKWCRSIAVLTVLPGTQRHLLKKPNRGYLQMPDWLIGISEDSNPGSQWCWYQQMSQVKGRNSSIKRGVGFLWVLHFPLTVQKTCSHVNLNTDLPSGCVYICVCISTIQGVTMCLAPIEKLGKVPAPPTRK